MNKTNILLVLALINLNTVFANNLELTTTEQILLNIYEQNRQDARQDALKLIPAIEKLETYTDNQNNLLHDYQYQLDQLKQDLIDILDSNESSLELANSIIAKQQDLLIKYRRTKVIQACVITALLTGGITALAIKYHLEPKTVADWLSYAKTKLPSFLITK